MNKEEAREKAVLSIGKRYFNEVGIDLGDALEFAFDAGYDAANAWNVVSEVGLPTEIGEYEVTARYNQGRLRSTWSVFDSQGWDIESDGGGSKVIAWREFAEPYNPKESV